MQKSITILSVLILLSGAVKASNTSEKNQLDLGEILTRASLDLQNASARAKKTEQDLWEARMELFETKAKLEVQTKLLEQSKTKAIKAQNEAATEVADLKAKLSTTTDPKELAALKSKIKGYETAMKAMHPYTKICDVIKDRETDDNTAMAFIISTLIMAKKTPLELVAHYRKLFSLTKKQAPAVWSVACDYCILDDETETDHIATAFRPYKWLRHFFKEGTSRIVRHGATSHLQDSDASGLSSQTEGGLGSLKKYTGEILTEG